METYRVRPEGETREKHDPQNLWMTQIRLSGLVVLLQFDEECSLIVPQHGFPSTRGFATRSGANCWHPFGDDMLGPQQGRSN